MKEYLIKYSDRDCYLELRNLILCSSQQKCSILETPLLESPSMYGHPAFENCLPQYAQLLSSEFSFDILYFYSENSIKTCLVSSQRTHIEHQRQVVVGKPLSPLVLGTL